jgi:hypothetical protein
MGSLLQVGLALDGDLLLLRWLKDPMRVVIAGGRPRATIGRGPVPRNASLARLRLGLGQGSLKQDLRDLVPGTGHVFLYYRLTVNGSPTRSTSAFEIRNPPPGSRIARNLPSPIQRLTVLLFTLKRLATSLTV